MNTAGSPYCRFHFHYTYRSVSVIFYFYIEHLGIFLWSLTRKSKSTDVAATDLTMSQPMSELSDQELLEELCDYGATPGPILPSTRSLYEKKLMKLRGAPDESLTPKHRYEEVPDDEENSPPPKKRSPKPVRKRVVPKRPEPLNIEHDEQVENDLRHSQDTTTEPEKEKSGGISMIMKCFVFLIVAFVVYLIIKNMEPARRVPLN